MTQKQKSDTITRYCLWGGVGMLLLWYPAHVGAICGNGGKLFPFDVIGYILLGVGLYRTLRSKNAPK
jgi:hypothetical protein